MLTHLMKELTVPGLVAACRYGPDCADRLPKNKSMLLRGGAGLGDYPRVAIARATDPQSPYLLGWQKAGEPVAFDGPPCSFPGRVWRSEVGDYWNMLCSFGQGKSWARFVSKTPSFLTWTVAEEQFTRPNVANGGGGALFHPLPNALAGGPTHLINGNTGSEFFLGNYDAQLEVMNVTTAEPQKIDHGTLLDWSAAGDASDGRLLLIGKVDGNPGAGRSYGSLVRELRFDRAAGQLISRPVVEYEQLRNSTILDQEQLQLPAGGTAEAPALRTLFAGGPAGGALDVRLSFDLSVDAADHVWSGFGVAVRAAPGSVRDAAMRMAINVSAADGDGVRTAVLTSTAPTIPPPPIRREVLPEWLNGTDLDAWSGAYGSTSAHYPEDTSPAFCQQLCLKNPDCKAWTHELRHAGPGVECRLHNGKPSHGAPVLPCPLQNLLCTSGAKTPLAFSCLPKKSTWITGGGNSSMTVKVLPGETLSLRVIVDRPIIEVFAQDGRAALTTADQIFTLDKTAVHLFNSGPRSISANASVAGMGCGWADALPVPKAAHKSDDVAPVGWWTFAHASGDSVPDDAGHGSGRMDLAGTQRVSLGLEDAFALRVFGNTSSQSFTVNSSAINAVDEWTLTFWVNFFWGLPTLCTKGDQLSYLQLYDGYFKYEMKAAGGKIEGGPYPRQCGWLQPGQWQHVALSFNKVTGTATLLMDGTICHNTTVGKGALKHSKDTLDFANFSGFLADVRVYDRPLTPSAVWKMYDSAAPIYNQTAFQQPSPEEIARAGRGWKAFPTLPGDESMQKSWLNYEAIDSTSRADTDEISLVGVRQLVWQGQKSAQHPTLRTAVSELTAVLPRASLVAFAYADSTQPSVLIGTCADIAVATAVGSVCPVLGEEAFALRLIDQRLVVVGGGDSGVLYGAFAVVRHAQLGTAWDSSAIDSDERPSTTIRLLNHWSVWRGSPQDQWMPARTNRSALPAGPFREGGSSGPYDDGADRSDSIFSWADLKAGPAANSTARIRAWARLLASVCINSLAPQDVNWFESSNFLLHLAEVKTLGTILRGYGIRLFFTPNYLLASEPGVADKLYEAVPDFGGYLLKVGSESQGGIATPENINIIAKVLRRPPGSGQRNGTAVVRGFIYGSTYCKDHDESKTNRMAIPAMFFRQYDGKYDANVFIMGKYSALDYETTEPINPLDGLLRHTGYGPDVEVGKGFPMAWTSRWEEWLNFDNMRGAGSSGTRLLNRETTTAFLGVCILGTNPSWTDNPLNMVRPCMLPPQPRFTCVDFI
jgi:hypothetical protein